MKRALVVAGSRGIGKGIADALGELPFEVVATSRKELDTAKPDQVARFCAKQPPLDVLILNTGGPPAKNFFEIKLEEWERYHNQLFVSFCLMLQKLKINHGGYIFLISSFYVKEPEPSLVLSNAYRTAMVSVLKSLTKELAAKQISTLNIAPGPIKTDRLYELVEDMELYEQGLPMKRAGTTREIGAFVRSIVEHEIKYLSGITINFDGGASNFVF